MTLKEIKAMFREGETWKATRKAKETAIVGNLGTTRIPAIENTTARTVSSAKSQLVWKLEDGRNLYTDWPKAADVEEARDGYLRFHYDNGTVVELERTAKA